MSSKNNHILDEIGPLLSQSEDVSHIREYIDIFSIYKPKITIDRTFQRSLRMKLLAEKNIERNSYFASHSFFMFLKIFSVAAACFVLTLGYFDIFFPEMTDREIQHIEKKTDIILPQSTVAISPEKILPKNIQAFKREKEAIDNEMSSIIDDINSIHISPTTPQVTNTSESVSTPQMQLDSYASDSVGIASTMAPMNMRMSPVMIQSPVIQIPEYPALMDIYIKSESWTNTGIPSRSASGTITRSMSTEKRSIIINKIKSLLLEREILEPAVIAYQVRSKIIRESENLSYLIPVIEYTLLGGEKISIPLIRGFR